MAVIEIPSRKISQCDGCKKEHEGSPPSNWTALHIKAYALDYQGAAVADASVSRILCASCSWAVHKAVNDAITGIRAALSQVQP